MDSIHTIQTEGSCSLEPSVPKSQIKQRGEQTDIRLQGKKEVLRAAERGAKLLTWLQTGLYLSPGLFRIF